MELNIKSLENKEIGKAKLPSQFNEFVRKDLILRAVLAIESNGRQPYGSDPEAGKKHVAKLSRRRRKYRGSYGHGISRVPRKIMSRNGTRFNWVGAFAPGTVGGRRAHPPKAEKIWAEKLNDKERRKAIRSALAAAINKDLVVARGHFVPEDYPFIIDDKFEGLEKTKEVMNALLSLGFDKELARASVKKIRGSKGKIRGRRYKKKKSVLIITSKVASIYKAAKNIPGVDIINVQQLNAKLLAPGGHPGRAILITKKALDELEKNKLFM
jgi:large subunit ribosomal protein L4e